MNDYPSLNVAFPEKKIFIRLGGHFTKTVLSPEEKCRFLSAAHTAFAACSPKGRWDILPVEAVGKNGIRLAGNSFIPGAKFAALSSGITHLWFGAVTVGKHVVTLRDSAGKISDAATYDAAASETADEAMNLLHRIAAQSLLKSGLFLASRRYSPGFGDMPLDIQQFFFEKLRLAELDMTLNENFFITPEKSVTAFAGITSRIDL